MHACTYRHVLHDERLGMQVLHVAADGTAVVCEHVVEYMHPAYARSSSACSRGASAMRACTFSASSRL